jgi:hypothetical protein
MEIDGIPLHPLIVHAVVVFAPLAAVLGLAYAAIPRWRWWLRWPMVACSLIAVGGAVAAAITGEDLLESRPGLEELAKVQSHQEAGERLRNVLLVFAPVALVAAWRLGGPSGLASGRGARARGGGVLGIVVAGLLVVASLVVLVTTFLAGHSGSDAVWGS